MELARKHYVCSKDPASYAEFLYQNFENYIKPDDEDLTVLEEDHFMALAVLQVLCIGRLGVATKLLHLLTEKENKFLSRPPYTSALLNFTWLLTFCVQLKSVS